MKSEKIKKAAYNFIYPAALLILPLLTVNQGVDVSDSTYSLGNYLFADRLDGMWVISTYLSNVFGSVLIKLPGAKTLLGANIYTGLVLAAVALCAYFFLKNEFDPGYVFLGESIAVCLCWIPTGILYNYASYLFMTLGALLLYKGVTLKKGRLLFFAGLVLGMNVFVRIPNLTQMALILVLWAEALYTGESFKNTAKRTGICISGYAVGVLIPFVAIVIRYGIGSIGDMISGLAGITSTDETYTPAAMIMGTVAAYIRSSKWVLVILAVIAGGIILFRICDGRFYVLKTVIYAAVLGLMIRFFWGRGMFSFRYYEDYSSMYEWGMLALYLSIFVDIYTLIAAGMRKEDYSGSQAALAVMSLVIIAIAPLGSNNYTYQNLNNMFVVMPITIILSVRFIERLAKAGRRYVTVPTALMLLTVVVFLMLQSFGFNLKFVFRDGMRGEARDTEITGVSTLRGMYTNKEHAQNLMKLWDVIEADNPDSLILYGDCPGLTYILGRPSALFTSWADLDSNPVEMVKEDLDKAAVNGRNISVIIRKAEPTSVNFEKKLELIMDFITANDYSPVYENAEYTVYRKE